MQVDRGFNLYVDVTSACNAECPFCIAPTMGRTNEGKFLEGLRWALDFTQDHYGSVQVTGGEPTLSVRLIDVMREIRQRMFHRVVLNTNGSGIKTPSLVIDLEASGFTHVNLSRHHYDETKNQEIMRFHRAADSADERFIGAVELVLESGMLPRVNCNLLRGYVDSIEEIEQFVAWCESIGVRSVSFSETFPLSVFDQNLPIVPGYAESHAVDLGPVVAAMDRKMKPVVDSPERLASAWGQPNGWSSSYIIFGHRRFWNTPSGGLVSIKTLSQWNQDGSPRPPQYDKQSDPELQERICFAVVHPDGTVSASWDKRERILFAPQRMEVMA